MFGQPTAWLFWQPLADGLLQQCINVSQVLSLVSFSARLGITSPEKSNNLSSRTQQKEAGLLTSCSKIAAILLQSISYFSILAAPCKLR